ncbi:MAG: hypothetical protein AB7I59_11085 [Geminicoccaceae bacterium]
MLVFDDRAGDAEPRQAFELMRMRLREAAAQPPGIVRHGALVAELVAGGELVQGLADAAFERSRLERRTPAERAAMRSLCRIARAVRESWDSGFATYTPLPDEMVSDLLRLALPARVRAKPAEGFAFYSLYPESYLEAARAAEWGLPPRVVGVRSIGVPLAAVVADALRSAVPMTLRPIPAGETRIVRASPGVTAELLRIREAGFAVVDEGPGWSGTSFGAVGDLLEDEGVPLSRIHFYCSHLGRLPDRASARHRARWSIAKRHAVDPIELIVHRPRRPEHRLAAWIADLIGPVEEPLQDLSQGAVRGASWMAKEERRCRRAGVFWSGASFSPRPGAGAGWSSSRAWERAASASSRGPAC